MRSSLALALALVFASGCRTTGVLVEDTAGTDAGSDAGTDSGTATDSGTTVDPGTDTLGGVNEGFGGTVGASNTGSGAAAGEYRVDAHVWAVDTSLGGNIFLSSTFKVSLWTAAGQPLSGATVQLGTLNYGVAQLAEDLPNNPGSYTGEQFGYDRTYALSVEGPAGVFEATAVGPAIHTVDAGPLPVDRASAWEITWGPSGADGARIDTVGDGQSNTTDDGAYTVPAGSAEYQLAATGEEHARVTRWTTLALDGAAPNSAFAVSVRMSQQPIDVIDSRAGDVSGQLDISRNLRNDRADAGLPPYAGMMVVLAWPRVLDPYAGAPWEWTTVSDWPNNQDYQLLGLAPGEWHLLAYLDVDGSDLGQASPAGPDQDEPFTERDVTVGVNGNTTRDLSLNSLW